jgi:cytochrome c oxidase subunit 2
MNSTTIGINLWFAPPANTGIRCMVRSADVIHSFALPGCMLKVDAIPGRVNEVPITVNSEAYH